MTFFKLFRNLLFALVLLPVVETVQAAQSLDRAIVIVNGAPITEKQLQEEVALFKKHQSNGEAPTQGMVLKKLIMDEVMLQLAQRNGLDLDAPEVDQMVDQRIQAQEVPPELAKNKEKLKRRMIVESMQYSMLADENSKATEEEIKEQMQNLPREVQQAFPVRFDLETLVIPKQETATTSFLSRLKFWHKCKLWGSKKEKTTPTETKDSVQVAQEMAKEALQKAKEGISFKEIAASQKEKLVWKVENISRTQDKLPVAYTTALASLNPQEVAGPFEFYNGFHLIRLKKVSGPKIIAARHILLKANEKEDANSIKQKLENIRQNCLASEKSFAEQAEKYSEDMDTVFKGGDLGWILPGSLDKKFEEVLEKLKPQEVSLPFETSQGVHIVQLIDKQFFTPAHPEWKRYIAKRLVEERKMLENLENKQKELYQFAHIQWVDPAFKQDL